MSQKSPTTVGVQLDRDNPWPGLVSYDEPSHEFFSGRTAEADELQRRIFAEPTTVLFGKSGLGKTSLLKAGVFPSLREKGLLPVLIRLHVYRGITSSFAEQARLAMFEEMRARGVEAAPASKAETLWEYLHRPGLEFWTRQNRLVRPVFVFDQFEELFTLGRAVPREVAQFCEDLSDLAENRIPAIVRHRPDDAPPASEPALDEQAMPYKIVIALREDFLADLEGWRLSMPSLRRNRMRLLPLAPDQAVEAVFNEKTRHLVTASIARRIVVFLSASGDSSAPAAAHDGSTVEPALLSLFCQRVNEHRQHAGKSAFDEELIEGGKGTIVTDFYRQSVTDQPERVRRFIEEELITEHGFRNSYAVDSAVARGSIETNEIDTLVNRHLLRREYYLGADRIELTHDLLTRAVVDQRDERRLAERAEEARRQRLRMRSVALAAGIVAVVFMALAVQAVRARDQARNLAALADDARDQAERNRDEIQTAKAEIEEQEKLTASQLQLLQASDVALNKALKTANQEKNRADLEGSRSRSRELAAHSSATVNTDPELAIVLAMEALKNAETTEGRSALLRAAQYAWPTEVLNVTQLRGEPKAIALSPDGNRLAAVAMGGTITLWDVGTGSPSLVWKNPVTLDGSASVAFSPDQTLIAVGRTRSVDLLDAGTGQLTRRLTPPLDDDDRRVVFSSDNRWLATTVRDNRLQLWDYRDQTATAVDVSDDVIESGFAILPGGKRIISVMSSPQLRAYALDQQPDGKWVSTELDLSECASPQSVSPGSESFSASWKARACTYPSTGGHSVEIWSGNRATEDIVWSAGGRSFAEIMSHELIVGRQLQSGRTESWIKGVHPTEANERSRLISVSEDGARVALIDDDEHKLVRIISVADHKPFLSRLPADQMALAPDTSFMAVVKPAVNGKGAVIEVLPIAEQTFTAVHKRTRIAVDVAPLEIHATNHSIVVVRATDPPTTTAFDATTGRRQFEPLTGVGRPVGSRGELLLVQPVRGDQSRVVRTRDGASVAQWRRSIGEPLVWVSPAKTALAIRGDTSYDPPLDRVLVYTVSNEDLSPMGQVVMSSQKLKSAARVLEVADDGRSIGIVGSNGPVWPVRREETDRPTRATERDRVADSISPLGRYQVEDEAGRIRVVRRADKAVLKRFQASVRSDFSRDDPWLFSRDDRWLVVRSNNDLQLLDLARGEIAFALATGNGEIETIAFEGGNRLLRIQLEEDESRTTMLVPLNVGLLKKFTAWLTPRTLTSQERCLYGFGGKECRSEIAPPRGIGPAAR